MQPSLFSKEPSGSKSRPKDLPKLLMRYCWQRLQNGQTEFVDDDTEDAFNATAQQVSKAVRRFNERDRKFFWPGLHFSARVIGVYQIRIAVEQEPILRA